MRIKWTSIHSVVETNPAAPWIGPGLAERMKREAATVQGKREKQDAKRACIGVASPKPIEERGLGGHQI